MSERFTEEELDRIDVSNVDKETLLRMVEELRNFASFISTIEKGKSGKAVERLVMRSIRLAEQNRQFAAENRVLTSKIQSQVQLKDMQQKHSQEMETRTVQIAKLRAENRELRKENSKLWGA